MTSEPTRPRALTGLAPRRSLGTDPGLALLRRDSREVPPRSIDEDRSANPPRAVEDAPGNSASSSASPFGATTEGTPTTSTRAGSPADRLDGSVLQSTEDSDLPRYLQFTRKESRIRADQADRLAVHVRRLNRARRHRDGPVGERITDNTLIRVAIDLLLDHADQLVGMTEDELRESVSH